MKSILLSLVMISFVIACSKDDTQQQINSATPSTLQNKTWMLDSVITVTPNYTDINHLLSGDVQTVTFASDTLVKSAGANQVTYNSYYDGTNLYYWLPGSVDTRSVFWQIVSVTDSQLVLKELPQSDKTVTYYYHAR